MNGLKMQLRIFIIFHRSGYHIVSLESGKYINLTAQKDASQVYQFYGYHTEVSCWVKKNKIEELLKLAEQ